MSQENPPPEELNKEKYIEPHDEIYKKFPDDLIINDWWTNLPGGRKKIGEMIDEPLESHYRKLARGHVGKHFNSLKGRYETEEELYESFVGKQAPKSERRLKLSDYEFQAIVKVKMKEAGIDIEEIRKMNERMNEIDDMHERTRTREIDLERDRLLRAIEIKTGVVRRMLLRDGFSKGDLSVS